MGQYHILALLKGAGEKDRCSCIKKRGDPPATEAICKAKHIVFGPLLLFQLGFALKNN